MATVAKPILFKEHRQDLLSGTPRAHAIDRWIFVAMATWYIAIVLLGFIPDAIGMVAAAKAGQRPPLPIILHVHAVVMGSFLLLLLTQSVLMATGRCELHKRVGVAAFVLVPVLVVVGLLLALTIYREFGTLAAVVSCCRSRSRVGRGGPFVAACRRGRGGLAGTGGGPGVGTRPTGFGGRWRGRFACECAACGTRRGGLR